MLLLLRDPNDKAGDLRFGLFAFLVDSLASLGRDLELARMNAQLEIRGFELVARILRLAMHIVEALLETTDLAADAIEIGVARRRGSLSEKEGGGGEGDQKKQASDLGPRASDSSRHHSAGDGAGAGRALSLGC